MKRTINTLALTLTLLASLAWGQFTPSRITVTTDATGALINPGVEGWDPWTANAPAIQSAVADEWGATTVGESLLTLPAPGAIRFLRINADGTVSALSASDQRAALGLGTAAVEAASAFATAAQGTLADTAVQPAGLTNYRRDGASSSLAVNWENVTVVTFTLSGNSTFTFSNIKTGKEVSVFVTQPAEQAWGINWPAAVTWLGATPGTIPSGTTQEYRFTAISPTAVYGQIVASRPVSTSRTISTGTGLTGGGDLTANRTLGLSSGTLASLGLADTALQPGDVGSAAYYDDTDFANALSTSQRLATKSSGQALVADNGSVVFAQPHQPGLESWSMALSLAVDTAPTATQNTALFGTGRTITTGQAGTWMLRYSSTGLRLMLWSDDSTSAEYTVTGALTLGSWYDLALTYDASTTTLRFYVDGAQTFSEVITPVDLDGTWPLKLLAGGSTGGDVNNGRNRVRYAHLYNFRLTPQNVADIHTDPRQAVRPLWRWGRDALYAWDWSAGVDGWIATNASLTGNIDDIGGEDDTLRIEIDDSASTTHYARLGADDLTLGMRWVRIRGKIFVPSANVTTQAAQVSWASNANMNWLVFFVTIQDEWVSFDEVAFVDNTLSSFRLTVFGNSGVVGGGVTYTGTIGDYIYLKDFRVDQVGASLALTPDSLQPHPGQWLDQSHGKNHGLMSQGWGRAGLAIPKERFTFTWTRSTSGFLGDADRRVLPPNFVIDQIIWRDAKGTKTTASLGHSAGSPASHVASFTPTASTERATVVASSANVTDQRLYLNMTANAGAVTVTVTGFTKPY